MSPGTPTLQQLATLLLEGSGEAPDPARRAQVEPLVAQVLGQLESSPRDRIEPFFRHLAGLLATEGGVEALGSVFVDDLLLAYSCSLGDPEALARFEREYAGELKLALARLRIPADHHDDVRQELWRKLFLTSDPATPEGRARILDYSGRGRLRSWYRVAVVRALLDLMRKTKRSEESARDELIMSLQAPDSDPEIEHLKRLYSHEFRAAFEAAVLGLAPEDRNTLRCYYAQRMTVDEIAVAFGIHRATAARRVARARERLSEDTRRALAARLSLSGNELESVIRLLESNLHVSVGRLLG